MSKETVEFKIGLNVKVKCRLTGFEGITDCVIERFTGCKQMSVRPPVDKDGKMQENWWIDEEQLEIVELGEKKGTDDITLVYRNPTDEDSAAIEFMFGQGDEVEDITSGVTGIVVGRLLHLNKCVDYHVQPPLDEKGKRQDCVYIAEVQLKLVSKEEVEQVEVRKAGGAMSPSGF